MGEILAIFLGLSIGLLLLVFLAVTLPYAIAFMLTAFLFDIRQRSLLKSYLLAVLNLIVPFILVGA